MKSLNVLVFALVVLFSTALAITGPVIGIIGVPVEEGCVTVANPLVQQQLQSKLAQSLKDRTSSSGAFPDGVTSCFDSFYVKWLEQGGARVVPVPFNLTQTEISSYFDNMNGLLFTGGGLNLTLDSPYVQTANGFFQLAQSKDDFFPIWGTCQGFQLLNILAAQNQSVLCEACYHGVDDTPMALDFTAAANQSRMFSFLTDAALKNLATKNITQNFHVSGVPPETYNSNKDLNSFYRVMSTNTDSNGKGFLSTMEAFNFPIYGTQWHPERPQFEWVPTDIINHTYAAVQAMQEVANFFIEEARKSTHSFPDGELEKYVIYNYDAVSLDAYGTQIYVY